ncbi:MAG: GrpB family protein [Scrofimicrobium sp.]
MATREEILRFDDGQPSESDPWVIKPRRAKIELSEYDARWPLQAESIRLRLLEALGMRAIRIEHIGSTSVEGLVAKPVIDIDVTVADPAKEDAWLPLLEQQGFILTVREPWWHEHRMLRGGQRADDCIAPTDGGPAANIHIFGPDSPELIKHIVFRNWLRISPDDRERYATAKRVAASVPDPLTTEYNARKQEVIREIFQRAFVASGFFNEDTH